KMIAGDIRRAGLIDILGVTGETNIQGEVVQKLDQRANETFVRVFESFGGGVKAVVSEEMEKPWEVGGHMTVQNRDWKYGVFIDPLDGSSNVDANLTVGSIFSVHRVRDR
ncbi:MAG: fructose-bisphosphatase class I, partial [Nitrospiraceae bacterium]